MFLESHGISVSPDSESTVSANPLYANAIGGIRIKVRHADAERAQELLKEYGESSISGKSKDYVCIKKTLLVSLSLGLLTGGTIGIQQNSIATGAHVFVLVSFFTFLPLTQVFRYKKNE